jgi:hypothetical protein
MLVDLAHRFDDGTGVSYNECTNERRDCESKTLCVPYANCWESLVSGNEQRLVRSDGRVRSIDGSTLIMTAFDCSSSTCECLHFLL